MHFQKDLKSLEYSARQLVPPFPPEKQEGDFSAIFHAAISNWFHDIPVSTVELTHCLKKKVVWFCNCPSKFVVPFGPALPICTFVSSAYAFADEFLEVE